MNKRITCALAFFCLLVGSHASASWRTEAAEAVANFFRKNSDEAADLVRVSRHLDDADLAAKLFRKGEYSAELTAIYQQYGKEADPALINRALAKRTAYLTDIGKTDSATGLIAPDGATLQEFRYHKVVNDIEEVMGVRNPITGIKERTITISKGLAEGDCAHFAARNTLYGELFKVNNRVTYLKDKDGKKAMADAANVMLQSLPVKLLIARDNSLDMKLAAPAVCGVSLSVSTRQFELKFPRKNTCGFHKIQFRFASGWFVDGAPAGTKPPEQVKACVL